MGLIAKPGTWYKKCTRKQIRATRASLASPPHCTRAAMSAVVPDHRSSTSDEKLAKVSSKHDAPAETVVVREAGVDDSNVPSELLQGRQLGLISAKFLMVNRIVGTGVFATTSTILAQSGSVGLSLM